MLGVGKVGGALAGGGLRGLVAGWGGAEGSWGLRGGSGEAGGSVVVRGAEGPCVENWGEAGPMRARRVEIGGPEGGCEGWGWG